VQPGIESRGKLVIGGLMVAILAFALIFLQQQFDQGDQNRAVELLMARPPGAPWSIAQELDARAGKEPPQCAPKIVSSFAGTMEVICSAGGTSYRFSIDLVRKVVQPVDPPTKELMEAVAAKNAAAVDAGTADASDAATP
jgi:hypothetical protein